MDAAGECVVTGGFFGNVTFGAGEPEETTLTVPDGADTGYLCG